MRHQLPVYSPIAGGALARGVLAAARPASETGLDIQAALAARLGAVDVVLTDSGTSALVLALRAVAGPGGVALLPAYGCIDLTAAALRAGVRVRLYDVDPATLSADLDSVRAGLARGADAVVVAHLYGVPADVIAVRDLAARHGVPVIEDAAQEAGGLLNDRPLGAFGALTVLSFGRGKGTTGGSGGALLVRDAAWRERLHAADRAMPRHAAGWGGLAKAAAQWMLGRPALYALPQAIPGLALGEMVYHPAGEPARMPASARAMLRRALAGAAPEVARRRRNAELLLAQLAAFPRLHACTPITGARPGWLRMPVRGDLAAATTAAARRLGIARAYPSSLYEHAPLAPLLAEGEQASHAPGAEALARHLFTLPTHSRITSDDLDRLVRWMRTA